MKKFAIILNTPRLDRAITADVIICSDGGAKHLASEPDYLIGDMDSISRVSHCKNIIKLPTHKNETDGEFAVRYAINELGAKHIDIYGITGGRADHVMCNLGILALGNSLGAQTVGRDNGLDIYYTASSYTFLAKKNDTISIVPFGCDAVVTARGLEYPLESLRLLAMGTRGISNVATDETVSVNVEQGAVVIFHYLDKAD